MKIFYGKAAFTILTGLMLLMTTKLIAQKCGSDIIVKNTPGENQRNVSLAVADNGWLYAGFVTKEGPNGGFYIAKSTDNGLSWSNLYSYSNASIIYDACKVIVCGPAPYKVFFGLIEHATGTLNYCLSIVEINGTTGGDVFIRLQRTNTGSKIYDFDIASDYLYPASGTYPYGVGVVYSRNNARDSLIFISSTNGGSSFGNSTTISTTPSFYGKVSLAYGRSFTFDNGLYYVVWEVKSAPDDATGYVRCAHNYNITSGFTAPITIDTYSCNPKIVCQCNNVDNDSSGFTTCIIYEYHYGNLDNDIIGKFNMRSYESDNWRYFSVDNSVSKNTKQPDICYDSYNNNFMVTYWDSTNTFLPYLYKGINMHFPNTWTVASSNYNNNTTMGSLEAPFPVIEFNPLFNQASYLWTSEGSGSNGVILSDAEYSTIGINELINYNNNKISAIYPNPAYGITNISIELKKSALVEINIYNSQGQKMNNLYTAQAPQGKSNILINLGNLANGNYLIELLTPDGRATKKMMVVHP